VNITDIIIIAALVFGAFAGFKKGFLVEIAGILSLILGVLLGFELMHLGVRTLEPYLGEKNYLPVAGFLLVFIVVVIGVRFLGKLIKKATDLSPLGTVDNAAGALFGALKVALVISVVFWLLDGSGMILTENMKENSFLYPYIMPLAAKTMDLVGYIMPFAEDTFESVRELLKEN